MDTSELLLRLHRAFDQAGKQLYLVGGSVRDLLLGRPRQDLDLATDARPEETKAILRQLRPDALYTVGEKFGTIGAVFNGHRVEITTFRSEQYTPGSRKPEVDFGTSLEGDLSRRDFTINAMARNLTTGEIIDPFGGLKDLEAGLIRAVGDPDTRFAEDPLRLLRAVRFAAELGFTIDPATAAAIRRQAHRLQEVSRERIAEELNRILLSPRPGLGIRLLVELGLLAHIVPEVLEMLGMPQDRGRYKDVFTHTLAVVENVPPNLVLRWAALLHDIAKPRTISFDEKGEVSFIGHELVGEQMTREILRRLRFDNRTIKKVAKLVRMHLRPNQYGPDWTDSAVRRLVREAGDDLEELLILSRADVTSARPARRRAARTRVDELERRIRELAERERIEALKSPLDGHELMAMFGLGPGPWIRPIKDYLQELVIEGQLAPDDKETARELALKFAAEHPEIFAEARPVAVSGPEKPKGE